MTTLPEEAVKAAIDTWQDHEFDGTLDYPRMRNALTAASPILAVMRTKELFKGTVDGDTELQAAARHAGWALIELVDEIDWLKREQVSDIITRLGIALNEPSDGVGKTEVGNLATLETGVTVSEPSAARELALEDKVRLDAATAALISLTEAGIPTDVQELLIVGDPSRGIAPGSLSKAIATVLRALSSPDHANAGKVEGDGSAAAHDVLAERRRQIEAEGWTPEHDDTHVGGEIAFAAASYVIGVSTLTGAVSKGKLSFPWAYRIWPRAWDLKWWKPSDRRRNLVKAGALIIAEIERLDRLSAPASEGAE